MRGEPLPKELRERTEQLEEHAAKVWEQMQPQQQAAYQPQIERTESLREQAKEIEERRKLNKELTSGQYALAGFVRNLAGGNPMGAAGAAAGALPVASGAVAGIGLALLQNIMRHEEEYQGSLRRGGATLSPSGAETERLSRELDEMQEARRTGERQRQRAAARAGQFRRAARTLPDWSRTHDPQDAMNFWEFSGRASRVQQHARNQYAIDRLTMTQPRAEARFQDRMAEYYENWIKEHGGKVPEFKQNRPDLGVQGGITSALAYQSELQSGALLRNDVSNEIMQEQLRDALESKDLLTDILNAITELNVRWE